MAGSDRRRFGLALSGGGFRASFFHLGVLSRLAELDLLRHVEVLSTVSGGSILGALYYLHVQSLLESKRDEEIDGQDYVAVVDSVTRVFLTAVQRNIRMRAYASPLRAARMAFDKRYTRSDRLAELYDAMLFRPAAVANERLRRGMRSREGESCRVRMTDLLVQPKDGPPDFDPVTDNEARRAKVPMLYVNATDLDTGRRWLFTPTWMGESFGERRRDDPDVNAVLRGFYYESAPTKYRNLPLGVAVAASAGVPGLFPPLPLTDLYDGWTPELVDGGVHDNLGTAELDAELGVDFLVSDASEPLDDARDVPPLTGAVVVRTACAIWNRLRDHTVERAMARGEPVVFVKGGLVPEQVSPRWEEKPLPERPTIETGIDPRVLSAIARIRTDLDAFSDVEADALMGAGYLVAKAQLQRKHAATERLQPVSQPAPNGWTFKWILPELKYPTEKLMRELASAAWRLGKTAQLPLRALLDWALRPAAILDAVDAGMLLDPPDPFTRTAGLVELAALEAASRISARAATFGIRAAIAARELAVVAATMPLALADLAIVNWVFLALERRPHPSPSRPALPMKLSRPRRLRAA